MGFGSSRQGSGYRSEDGHWLIELRPVELRRLFHHLDPAPYREKDLDPAVEEYVVEGFRDLGPERRPKILVHLTGAEAHSGEAQSLPDAVRRFFGYRAEQARIELRRLIRQGLASLMIGLSFLFVCLWLRKVVADREMLAEGLQIIGWVALWRPVQIFLYDWWPIYRRQRRFERIATLPVEVRERPR
jgi:hypothetical protein